MGALTLPKDGRVYLDANCIIYRVERIEPYLTLLTPVFEAAKQGRFLLVTSELSLLECLVKPVQQEDSEVERLFRTTLGGSREVRMVPIGTGVLERSVRLRAERGLKTPDAIHAATALESQCGAFFTNDAVFLRVAELGAQVLHQVGG